MHALFMSQVEICPVQRYKMYCSANIWPNWQIYVPIYIYIYRYIYIKYM